MTDNPSTTAAPRLRDPEAVAARHGAAGPRLLSRGLAMGDPLADAAVAELSGGAAAPARAALATGLREGLAALTDPPPAVAALLADAEAAVAAADPALLERGDVASMTVDAFWSRISFALGSLVHTYSAPAIARVLTGTGRLTGDAERRLAETGLWRVNAILPGGLRVGAPGYVDSVQVRLLHARVRAAAQRRGWDTARWGVPVNQVDLARTWLDFTVVPFRALARVGIALTPEEERDLYRYWHTVAALMGVDPDFHAGAADHATAGALLDLLEAANDPPDDHARALVHALIDALAGGQLGSLLGLAEPEARRMLHALTRLMQGDTAADALGIPAEDIAPFVPLIALPNARLREAERATPDSWQRALAAHTAYRRTEFAHLETAQYRTAADGGGPDAGAGEKPAAGRGAGG
ncbi:DUF2236 domain-containing protein [Streptomonospora sp. S1-112]|uniref:DUF2236 domain-containing protein n=1 Tax=Streptomonospora mangrovi TaxID=2883123 RepID=A0A9X3NPT9_9ACTN|nr:oxygenase MpaB family protein [Streptomonospora mangrovi]MDA0566056.1 DUF2236 domain-containing protein [Streptomonospora mangrovi]